MEHHFNTYIAKEYGIEEAILIHHFYYWIAKNAANNKHFHDGLYWTYNSKRAYADFFIYINDTKIFRVIKHLEDEGLIAKGNYNNDKWDKTNWYAITRKGLELLGNNGYDTHVFLPSLQNDTFDSGKMNDGELQSEQCILINNTDSNTYSNKKENTNVFPQKNDYKAIVDCWNKYNGEKLGKVTKLTEKRKKAIKKQIEDNGITQEQLICFFKSLPFADSWLYHPNKQHSTWKPDFDWWMANTNGWLTKGLEGKVHKENYRYFELAMGGDDVERAYSPQGRSIWYDENTKSYWSNDNFYYGTIDDGYDDDNRPDGAEITLNNARGTYKWNTNLKKWIKK